jgi:hypothetical protein
MPSDHGWSNERRLIDRKERGTGRNMQPPTMNSHIRFILFYCSASDDVNDGNSCSIDGEMVCGRIRRRGKFQDSAPARMVWAMSRCSICTNPSQRNNLNVATTPSRTCCMTIRNLARLQYATIHTTASSTQEKKVAGCRWQDIDSYLGIFLILIVSLLPAFIPLSRPHLMPYSLRQVPRFAKRRNKQKETITPKPTPAIQTVVHPTSR